MKSIALIFLFILGFGTAKADVMIEPYAGYYMGTLNYTVNGGNSGTTTDSGLGAGLRLAYKEMGFWIGLDYLYAGTTVKQNNLPDANGTHTNLFADIGYEFDPIPIRIFAGYGFINQFKVAGSNGANDTNYSGTSAYKIGAGYSILPILDFNIEYMVPTINKYNTGGSDQDISTLFSSFNASAWLISLSLPLSF